MRFIKELIRALGNVICEKILANPLSFLGVTIFFMIIFYFEYISQGIRLNTEEILVWGIGYVIALSAFMTKKAVEDQEVGKKTLSTMENHQKVISVFSYFKNIKK